MITADQWAKMSPAEQVALDPQALTDLLNSITPEEAAALLTDWEGFLARPSQREPACDERCGSCAVCDWKIWLLLAGRGFG